MSLFCGLNEYERNKATYGNKLQNLKVLFLSINKIFLVHVIIELLYISAHF
jgi:hypothetical protein